MINSGIINLSIHNLKQYFFGFVTFRTVKTDCHGIAKSKHPNGYQHSWGKLSIHHTAYQHTYASKTYTTQPKAHERSNKKVSV
ncbi:MAG: hypothetical protein ABIN91_21995 [Mucilaginibacter sp.]|uniref:hypothetical protein n=1 Tax=Mucilaginibacter sp. TaxID=1882438 RepID=UPI0032670819